MKTIPMNILLFITIVCLVLFAVIIWIRKQREPIEPEVKTRRRIKRTEVFMMFCLNKIGIQ